MSHSDVPLLEVQRHIGSGELSYWDIINHFEPGNAGPALGEGLRGGQLKRREEPGGWVYRQVFPGVDIDAAHRKS